jgi:DNA repair photolyase
LFPGVPSATDTAEHTGIARLAASSPCAQARNGTEYFLLPVRSILNRCDSGRVPFAWTVNPYRGCEFGCRYCYARYTHEFMDLPGSDFEKKIFVKQEVAAIFARDLDLHDSSLASESMAIGTATDPYQPAEREFGVTRSLLERLAGRSGLSLSITTKSNLITRDLDLLRRIAEKNDLSINITVTTLRPRLARLLEPRAPRPDLRLAALRALRDAGLDAGVFAMPVLPGLTDREADLDNLFLAAREAGALWLGAQVVFLRSAALKEFLSFLDGKFPKLARDYRRWYARTGYAPEKIRAEITARVRALRQKHGLASRPYAADRLARASSLGPPQLSLPLAV